jgi:phosphohistidine phosphatase
MRTLLLLRHGKAVPADSTDDHARALSPRGRRQVATVAELLARLGLTPDRALVSDSRRTRETAEIALANSATRIDIEPQLYGASAQALLAAVHAVPDEVLRLIVIGHNPGIGELGRLLEGSGEPQAVIAMQESFPTGALAVFEFDGQPWAELGPGSGCLTRFIDPDEGPVP